MSFLKFLHEANDAPHDKSAPNFVDDFYVWEKKTLTQTLDKYFKNYRLEGSYGSTIDDFVRLYRVKFSAKVPFQLEFKLVPNAGEVGTGRLESKSALFLDDVVPVPSAKSIPVRSKIKTALTRAAQDHIKMFHAEVLKQDFEAINSTLK